MAFLLKTLALLSLLLLYSRAAAQDVGFDVPADLEQTVGLGLGDYSAADDDGKTPVPQDDKPKGPKNAAIAGPKQPKAVSAGKSPNVETNYEGAWTLENENVGVCAMHMQLLPNNKAIMYDATSLGPSGLKLPDGMCRPFPDKPNEMDCFAHAIEYDVETKQVRPIKLETNAWCSSGGLTPEGDLISTGGFLEGGNAVRILSQTNNGVMQENPKALAGPRWYASQEKLGDGSYVIFGGRREFSIEVIQRDALRSPPLKIDFFFLNETTDPFENNLYPYVHLLPDGNVYLFANRRSVIVAPKTGQIIRELPQIPGGARNYPASGSATLLPINLGLPNPDKTLKPIKIEVLICGGADSNAVSAAEKGNLLPALQDCGRITVTDPNPKWEMEMMPTRRVLHDMVVLPNGEVLILHGCTNGVAGWGLGDNPVTRPALYSPEKPAGQRFKELKAASIVRMYHSVAAVLQDGQVLVAGSNTNPVYNFTAKFPTELRVEKFAPHYTDPALDVYRPKIVEGKYNKEMGYGQTITIGVEIEGDGIKKEDIKVTMLAPAFPTHGYSQNQRLVVMEAIDYADGVVTVQSPPSGNITPPGYFIMYVVHRGVPSRGVWVKIA